MVPEMRGLRSKAASKVSVVMTFFYKIHKSDDEVILAVADAEIAGKTFGDKNHSITVTQEFYGENEAEGGEILALAKTATIVNAIGDKITGLLLENNIAEKEGVVTVCGLKHAQVFVL